jgi:hypothetical protein
LIPSLQQNVTWVKVEPPTFDLVGVVLGALGFAGFCALVALFLGISFGVAIILRRQRVPARSRADEGLHLLEARRP